MLPVMLRLPNCQTSKATFVAKQAMATLNAHPAIDSCCASLYAAVAAAAAPAHPDIQDLGLLLGTAKHCLSHTCRKLHALTTSWEHQVLGTPTRWLECSRTRLMNSRSTVTSWSTCDALGALRNTAPGAVYCRHRFEQHCLSYSAVPNEDDARHVVAVNLLSYEAHYMANQAMATPTQSLTTAVHHWSQQPATDWPLLLLDIQVPRSISGSSFVLRLVITHGSFVVPWKHPLELLGPQLQTVPHTGKGVGAPSPGHANPWLECSRTRLLNRSRGTVTRWSTCGALGALRS
jgi:hypothetical protein